jgi:catechol 2,3-dioxygenase-like lactoylglutathione lyase family enzyme
MPIRSLHHVSFAVTDLAKTRRFAEDFGLLTVAENDGRLFMRTCGGEAWCYRAEQADERACLGLAFLTDSEADLHEAVEKQGASRVRELDSPGGGLAVSLTGPDGLTIDLVHGIAGDTPRDPHPDLCHNTPGARSRYADPQSNRPVGPAHLFRVGHVGLYVRDYGASSAWFENVLGLQRSDSMHLPFQPERTIGGFFRIDRGEEWVDHHSVFLVQSDRTDLHHVSFEVQDYEAQFRAHRWLESRGWEPNWGVGRHPLGSHVFDVWFDPDRYRFETFSDTDLVNRDHQAGHYDVRDQEMDAWSSDPPDRYFA